ncbi:hypothetical protein GOBAR_AA33382 [Gossypium barbadense]|uniref:Uncharacterized protein n=1 Tax=Gossypium barbadense TaxID=3634 RepID=A0A2P5W897_GOSBA|nr:hypothetical protein GOBAR_AA33382 [Gossypium barbadense]
MVMKLWQSAVQMGLDISHSVVEIEDDELAIVKKVLDFVVDEVEKDKCGLIRQTNFDRRKVVIVPDLAYMGKGDWSHKELLVFPKVLSLKGVWGVESNAHGQLRVLRGVGCV